MRSPVSLGLVFIVMGGLSLSGIGGRHAIGPPAWTLAGLLVIAGVALLLRRPFAFYLAIAAGLITAVTGVLAYAHHPEWALPVPPLLSIVVGIYLTSRTAIMRLVPADDRGRGFLPKNDSDE